MPPPNPSITSWTESLLEQERNNFWATRTEGDQEIWRGLQRTVGYLRDGDLKSAQTYFNASDLNCPTGNLLDDVYDAHGYKYEIPAWVVMTPASLYHGDSSVEYMRPRIEGSSANGKPEDGDAESAVFQVRCRFPLGKDVFINVREQELISSMVRKIRLQRTVTIPLLAIPCPSFAGRTRRTFKPSWAGSQDRTHPAKLYYSINRKLFIVV
jgi:hypothetical protein